MKNWNWTFFIIIFCTAMLGAMSNESVKSIMDALLLGSILGVIAGLPMAYLTRKDAA